MARHARLRALSSLTAPILALLAGVGFVVQTGQVAAASAASTFSTGSAAAPWSGGTIGHEPAIDPALPAEAGTPRTGPLRLAEGTGSGPGFGWSPAGAGIVVAAARLSSHLSTPAAARSDGIARAALSRAGRLAAPATGPPVLSS